MPPINSPFTAAERRDIYEKAMVLVEANVPQLNYGVCNALFALLKESDAIGKTWSHMIFAFPEFMNQYPGGGNKYCLLWWPPFQVAPRIEALQAAIAECNRIIELEDPKNEKQ